VETRYLNQEEYNLWNDFVDESPEGSIYGKSWYLEALQVRFKILVVANGNEIFAGIVLTKNEIGVYSNPLLCKYLGIFFKQIEGSHQKVESKKMELARQIIEKIKHIRTFDYTFHPNFINWLPFYWAGYKQTTKYSYRLKYYLIKDIKKQFTSKLRNEIKRIEKNNFKIDSKNYFNSYFDIIDSTFKKQGGKSPFSEKDLLQFFILLEERKSINFMNLIDIKDNLLAFTITVFDRKCAYLIFSGYNSNFHIHGVQEYLIFHTIEYYNHKIDYFDFEGSMIKEIESFYRKFGGELVEYYQIFQPTLINSFKHFLKPLYKKIKYGK
jgi:hypothetical protein